MQPRGNATRRVVGPVVIALAALAATAPPCGAQCRYEVTVLGSPDRPEPYAVNDSGYVVGVLLHFPTDFDAFLWPGQDPVVRLSMPSGPHSTAYDITEAGVVVGSYFSGSGKLGFVSDGNGTRPLGPRPGGGTAEARAVNENGVIVGFSTLRPVAWIDEKALDLSPMIGAEGGRANDVSDRDEIVGQYHAPDSSVDRAFLLEFETGNVIDIGVIPNGTEGDARAINNRRRVVVLGKDADTGKQRTFLWTSGQMTDLGVLPGDTETVGTDINDRGLVVGGSRGQDGVWASFLWHGGELNDVNDLVDADGIAIHTAFGVSDDGQLVCIAQRDTGETIGVRLSPVDPPVGDVTGDCRAGFDDVLRVLAEWGPCEHCIADTDGNGTVDFGDLLNVLSSWG